MVIGPTDPDSFADNVATSARHAGHEVLLAGPARRASGPRRARNAMDVVGEFVPSVDVPWQRHIVRRAADWRPDLALTVDVRLRPETVDGIHRYGSPAVLWFPDHVANLGNHRALIAGYERLYLKMEPVVEQLSRVQGLPVRYLPEAANPIWHRPSAEYGTERTIVVAGNIHPSRALLLERLLDAGIPLTIYGPAMSSWLDFPRLRELHVGRKVVREEKARIFRAARGVLNNLHPAELAGSNCRLFEATACGAAVLTEWRMGMSELFRADTEVLPFSTFEELLDKAKRLLDDAEFGRRVADAASQRALREHTYAQRLQFMLQDLGLA